MRRLVGIGIGLSVVGMLGVATAQQGPHDELERETSDQDGRRCDSSHRHHHGPPPPPPLMTALDTDRDGELSAEEIAGAADALLALDQDGDGKLTREEMKPPPPPRGEKFVEHVMGFDADGDGSVTAKELPPHMRRLLDHVDTNQDDAIDQQEAEEAGQQMEQRSPRRQGRLKRSRSGRDHR